MNQTQPAYTPWYSQRPASPKRPAGSIVDAFADVLVAAADVATLHTKIEIKKQLEDVHERVPIALLTTVLAAPIVAIVALYGVLESALALGFSQIDGMPAYAIVLASHAVILVFALSGAALAWRSLKSRLKQPISS